MRSTAWSRRATSASSSIRVSICSFYNYTPRAQFDRHWTEETMVCRGLILDGAGNVVQRPFRKFFNLEEHDGPIPEEPFVVYEKLDGSLGILYWVDDRPALATRGSFTSEQVFRGTETLRARYAHALPRLRRDLSYLFEIIYPGNRIVVDYGDTEDVVLLAAIETTTGREIDLPEIGFPVVKRYDGIHDLDALAEMEEENREGFVVHFPRSGLRLKVKFAEYVRLHRLITGVTERHVWEQLRDGLPIERLMVGAPAAYCTWLTGAADVLRAEHRRIEEGCLAAFAAAPMDGDRKTFAVYAVQCEVPAVLFKMYDGRPYEEIIWKLLRPVHPAPFKIEV